MIFFSSMMKKVNRVTINDSQLLIRTSDMTSDIGRKINKFRVES